MSTKEFEKGFKILYLPLCLYALRLTGDGEAARDCVQNAFLKAWEAVAVSTKVFNFNAYMYRAVHNQCLEFRRSLHPESDLEDIAEPTDAVADTGERDAALRYAVDALPARCREVFLLSKRDGMCRDEIAAQLGISVKTVQNQLTKAYDRLRRALSTSSDSLPPSSCCFKGKS